MLKYNYVSLLWTCVWIFFVVLLRNMPLQGCLNAVQCPSRGDYKLSNHGVKYQRRTQFRAWHTHQLFNVLFTICVIFCILRYRPSFAPTFWCVVWMSVLGFSLLRICFPLCWLSVSVVGSVVVCYIMFRLCSCACCRVAAWPFPAAACSRCQEHLVGIGEIVVCWFGVA